MAYSTTNPPVLVSMAPLAAAGQIWRYESTHTNTAVDAAGFFTNALDLGMRVKDLVLVYDTTTSAIHTHVVLTVSATGADLSDGTAIGSTANSD